MAPPCISGIPEWTDGAAYAPLLKIELAGFAWEWLRRRPDYVAAARRALEDRAFDAGLEHPRALAWNLHAFEDPRIAAPQARPVWAAPAHPWILRATARESVADDDALDLADLEAFAKLVRSPGGQRLLLSDGFHSIRLDLKGHIIRNAPVRLSYELSGIEALERPLTVLRRLRSLVMSGRFASSLHPPRQRAQRLIQLLRAYDAIQAGAHHIDIAEMLLRSRLERSRWRIHSPSARSQAQRLVKAARRMGEGQFWTLLD